MVLGLGSTNFRRVTVGIRRLKSRVVGFLTTGGGFNVRVRVSSRQSCLLSANKKVGRTATFLRNGRPFLVRGISVLSSVSLHTLCGRRVRAGPLTALLIDGHGASHCLLFGGRGGLYN